MDLMIEEEIMNKFCEIAFKEDKNCDELLNMLVEVYVNE